MGDGVPEPFRQAAFARQTVQDSLIQRLTGADVSDLDFLRLADAVDEILRHASECRN